MARRRGGRIRRWGGPSWRVLGAGGQGRSRLGALLQCLLPSWAASVQAHPAAGRSALPRLPKPPHYRRGRDAQCIPEASAKTCTCTRRAHPEVSGQAGWQGAGRGSGLHNHECVLLRSAAAAAAMLCSAPCERMHASTPPAPPSAPAARLAALIQQPRACCCRSCAMLPAPPHAHLRYSRQALGSAVCEMERLTAFTLYVCKSKWQTVLRSAGRARDQQCRKA